MLPDSNIELINSLSKQIVQKRIIHEYIKLKEKFSNIFVEKIDGYNGKIEIKMTIYCNSNTIFTMNIPNDYPFTVPRVEVGREPYARCTILPTSRFRKIYKELSGMDCICCSTILCNRNWCPSFKLLSIIEEYKTFQAFKSDIVRKICIDTIKDKYLLPDIDIESWLFGFNLNIQNTHKLK
jgi:ubiquitin-protein ligase